MASVMQLINRIRQTEFPVLTHEFRVRRKLKGQLTSVASIGVGVLTTWIFISAFANISDPDANRTVFAVLSLILLIVVGVLVPARSARIVAAERERHTFDLLALTLLRSSDIVLQKLFISVAEAMAFVTAAVPTMVVIGIRGGNSPLDMVAMYMILMATAFFVAAAGMFWSCRLRNTSTATFMTYATVLGLCAPTILVEMVGIPTPAHADWSRGWLPLYIVGVLAPAVALIILAVHLGTKKASGESLWRIRTVDAVGIAVGLVLLAYLVLAMGPNPLTLMVHGPLAISPLSAIIGLVSGRPHAWEMAAAALGFSAAGTMLLLHLSVRRFHALRCS